MKRRRLTLSMLLAFCAAATAVQAQESVVYVDWAATGLNDGTSWEDAFVYLQDALAVAGADEIWIAQGTYRPDLGAEFTPGDRFATFALPDGVKIYGGFVNGDSWGDRDWQTKRVILSGDLAENDESEFVNCEENSLNVVTASQGTAVLDGVTVTGGHDDLAALGAGLKISSAAPQVRNCTFAWNWAHGECG